MKRKIALLLTCILAAGLIAGCGSSSSGTNNSAVSAGSNTSDTANASDTSNTSDTSDTAKTSSASDTSAAADTSETAAPSDTSADSKPSAESKTESNPERSGTEQSNTSSPSSHPATESSTEDIPQGSQPGITIDEDGNIIIDPDIIDMDDESEPEESEEMDKRDESDFLDLSYQMTYLSPTGFSAGTQLPAAYYITSPAELSDFIDNNNKTYSLDVDYTDNNYIEKISFVTKAKDLNADYFDTNDALIVVSSYDKSDDCDLGTIAVKDNTATVEIWTQTPASAEQTGYICFVVNIAKGTLKDKTITAFTNGDFLSEEDE